MSSTPLRSSVEMRGDRPTLVLNGRPHAPLIYALSDCPGARWTWEEVPARNIRLFGEQGVRLFQCDLWFDQLLTAEGNSTSRSPAARSPASPPNAPTAP
ncbi:hypothetical protein [Oleiharenicola sp. Vm1]|uniref:hypothetical protein n=1 Tax=Oleiharenicola sp. Vm1 TaxID=3398393 RepID=UPI0039F5B9EF